MEGSPRQVCPACGWVHYPQLKVGAGVLMEYQGQLLLVRRGQGADAFAGTWGLPAGYCEPDEPPSVAAAREAAEETGIELTAGRLVGAYYFDDDLRGNGVLLAYEARSEGDLLEHIVDWQPASDEVDAVRFFAADALPESICGGGHDQAIEAWKSRALDRWEPGVPMRFCPHCANRLTEAVAFGRQRRVCVTCGFVQFREPKVGVSILVERDGRVLLVERAVAPGEGMWSLPSGFIEWDEAPEEAARRECIEETGLELRDLRLLDVVHYTDDFRGPGISLLYQGEVAGGTLRAGDDAKSARFCTPGELPPLRSIAFRGHRRVLKQWQEARASRTEPGLDG